MLTALDHIVLLCPDIETASADYQTLLGAPPVWQSHSDSSATVVFALGNTALELMASAGDTPGSARLRELTSDGARLTTLVYRSDGIEQDHHLLQRRGLQPTAISQGSSTDRKSSRQRHWQSFRIPDASIAGIKTFVIEPQSPLTPPTLAEDAVSDLDHLVIQTPNPDRLVANYGARLGLRLALDRTATQWQTRMLFFRTGNCTIEGAHRLDQQHDPNGDDNIWGLTWAVPNIDGAHRRLNDAGVKTSEVREGRKPGSHVFTVRDSTQQIPTLFISHSR